MTILAIDPGQQGALVWLERDGTGVYAAMPALPKVGILVASLVHEIEARVPDLAVVEQAQSFPGMGVSGAFSYGTGYGQILGALAALRVPYVTVRPDRWHREIVGRHRRPEGQSKDEARRLAKLRALEHVQRVLPRFDLPATKARREAVVEALCMALWARQSQGRST